MVISHYVTGNQRVTPIFMAVSGSAGALGQCGINSMALPPVLFAGSPVVQSQVVDEVIQGRHLEKGRMLFWMNK